MCERERECVCVRERVCVCERERECVCERERERECVCVHVRVCVCVCVFILYVSKCLHECIHTHSMYLTYRKWASLCLVHVRYTLGTR